MGAGVKYAPASMGLRRQCTRGRYVSMDRKRSRKEVIVIGAGIVGLSCAYHLLCAGMATWWSSIVTSLGTKASYGNAGGIAVPEIFPASSPRVLRRLPRWLIDPLGPLAIRPLEAAAIGAVDDAFFAGGSAKHRPQITAALFALSSRVYDDLLPMLHEIGLSNELHRVGALYVYRSIGAFEQDIASWETRRSFVLKCTSFPGRKRVLLNRRLRGRFIVRS